MAVNMECSGLESVNYLRINLGFTAKGFYLLLYSIALKNALSHCYL